TTPNPHPRGSPAGRLVLHYYVVLLDRDGHRLGDVRAGDAAVGALLALRGLVFLGRGDLAARQDVHVVGEGGGEAAPRAHERLAGGDVVLPAVPRAREQRRAVVHVHVAGAARHRPWREVPQAQRAPLVRAAV